MQKEIRKLIAIDLNTNIEDDMKIISGYINKYNTRSQYIGFYEEVEAGAFDKTLTDGHNIYAMYNHNDNMILGSTKANTLKLYTDSIGLKFELVINEEISYAKDVYELIKSGDINGCSFGFYVVAEEWGYTEDNVDLRIIKELELVEVTITPFPAYLDSEASCRSYEKHKEEALKAKELRELEKELELEELRLELI